jgi:hypothetical protein
MMENMEAYKEQPHRLRGTKPFITMNNYEPYEEKQHKFIGTRVFVVRNNVEASKGQPYRLRNRTS